MSQTALRLRLVVYGVLSLFLYILLFLNADAVLRMSSRTDGVFFLTPVVIALVFSLVHGAFTGYFWEVLGVQARHQVTSAKRKH